MDHPEALVHTLSSDSMDMLWRSPMDAPMEHLGQSMSVSWGGVDSYLQDLNMNS